MISPPHTLQETLYKDAEAYFSGILHAISSAQRCIDFEVYIFSADALGCQIIDALTKAAQRNVKVRLLVDGMGADPELITLAVPFLKAGGELRIFRPLPWHLKQWQFALSQSQGFKKLLHLINVINKRNHRKLVIIDQQQAWLGSFNISQKHLPRESQGEHWRDTAVCVSGIDMEAAQMGYDACWDRKHRKHYILHLPETPFLFNFNRALRIKQRVRLLKRLASAKERIWITNAYFVPDKRILNALIEASHRGVDVRILLPRHSDIFFIPWASAYFYGGLLQAGVRIFEFQTRMLHAKTMLIDHWAVIGSSNMNTRSLHHDLEVDYRLQLDSSKATLEQDFLADLKEAEELTHDQYQQQRRWQRLAGKFILFVLSRWV